MKRWAIPLAITLVLGLIPSIEASEDANVLVRIELYRIEGSVSGKTSIEGNIVIEDRSGRGKSDPAFDQMFTFFTSAQFDVGREKLIIDREGWSVRRDMPTSPGESLESRGKIALVVKPSILVPLGERAAMAAVSKSPIEYFEKREDGLFEHKNLAVERGLTIEFTPQRMRRGGRLTIRLEDLNFLLTTVADRQEIPGVNLPVGIPVVKNQELTTDIKVEPGKDYGILISPGGEQGVLIVRLRAEFVPVDKPVDEENKEEN